MGTFGGSYGGGFQFAVASVDARVDALVPFITWNDLSYSLAPNNTTRTSGVSSSTPGAAKLAWAAGFSAIGVASELESQQIPPDLPCPNFADFVCPALVTAGTTGFLQPGDTASLRHASVSSYIAKVKVPTLLVQGDGQGRVGGRLLGHRGRTRLDQMDVLGSVLGPISSSVRDLPGTFAAWSTPQLAAPLRVAGAPTVRIRVDAPTAAATQALGPAGQLVLFVKVVDVAPDGTATMINGLKAPVRIPDVNQPITVRLPAIVHEFAAGHSLRLVVARGSINHRGGLATTPVTIASGDAQTLSLPVVP